MSRKSRNRALIAISSAVVVLGVYFAVVYHRYRLNVDLIVAVKSSNAGHVRELLAGGADPNAVDSSTSSPITMRTVIERMLGKNETHADDPTALMLVFSLDQIVDLHSNHEAIEIAEALLHAGAHPNLTRSSGWYSNPVLMHATVAGCLPCVQSLLHYRADPNLRGPQGMTPIMLAPDVRIAEALIKSGADVNITSRTGKNAIWFAELNPNHPSGLIQLLRSHLKKSPEQRKNQP
ncbi:MAG: Ankyrin repeat protein [Chthonomonadales bacterium]|nr:Ankyrin repeat protein [Chthonomonadales bacterium]